MTGGRLVIQNFPAGGIVPGAQEIDAAQSGAIECYNVPISFWAGKFGQSVNFWTGYPAGPGPIEEIMWHLKGGGKELYKEMLVKGGYDKLEHLGFWALSSAELFAWSKKPLDTLEAFKGLKFRSGGMWGSMLSTLGASVVLVPGGEIYSAMEKGVIDAFEYTTPGNDYSMGFTEIAKYVYGPGIHSPMSWCEFTVNKDRWAELPDDIKAIVRGAVDASLIKSWAEMEMEDIKGLELIQKSKVEYRLLSKEVQDQILQVSSKFLDQEAAKDPFFSKVLQSQRDFLKKYRNFKQSVQPSIGM